MQKRSRKRRITPTRAIRLRADYLRAIEKLEALPENQSGADKTWVERANRAYLEHYARAVRVR